MLSNHIDVSNVRPAFETSLRFGATETEIAARTGLTRALLETDGATVPGDATYAHMELMFEKARFADFLIEAASSHTLASLGVVGLACKTAENVAQALARHQRYGHLTNRTASYSATVRGECLIFAEQRVGAPRLGSLLVSDYSMFIAMTVLRQSAKVPPRIYAMLSRRAAIAILEADVYREFLGADTELRVGAPQAALHLDPAVLASPVASADPELSAYFSGLLARSAAGDLDEDPLVQRVRTAIREALVHGAPSATTIAKSLGLGHRTLQRRLDALGTSYAELVETTRRGLAQTYLRDRGLGLSEVAYLLGYNEQTSFFRAFRRWHDESPSEYRRRILS